MSIASSRFLLLALAALPLLCACGGGDDGASSAPVSTDSPVAGSEVPTSATNSSSGAVAFVQQLAGTSNDTAEPIRVGDAVLAASDTDEPAGI